jgi:hypothetical protein
MAILNGDAYRQASYANIAMTLRDVGGFNSSLHKNLVGARSRRPTPRRRHQPLAGPQRPDPDVAAGIARQSGDAGERRCCAGEVATRSMSRSFGRELKLVKDGAVSGKYEHDMRHLLRRTQRGLGAVIGVRDAFYDNAEQILGRRSSSARTSFAIALAASSPCWSRASASS